MPEKQISKPLTEIAFASLDLLPSVQEGLARIGFTHCTPIRALTLPLALRGRDVAGQAQTGTGKTAAFLLVIFQRLLGKTPAEPGRHPRALVLEDGLVRQEKNRGVFVRDVALDEAMEIYDLRAMIDEAVGRRLAEAITPEQLKGLRTLVDAMDRAARASDAASYHPLNLEFHDSLVAASGNRKLTEVYRRLTNELPLFRRRNLADERQLPVSAGEHRAIVKAIASGDPDAAGRALREHVLARKARTLKNNPPPRPGAAATKPKALSHA